MARRRYQKGNLRKRGKRNPVWELQWWTDCINLDGTLGRRRESTILGYVSDLTRRQARKRAEEHLRPLNLGKVTPLSNLPLREFGERHFVPNVFPMVTSWSQARGNRRGRSSRFSKMDDRHVGTRTPDLYREARIQSPTTLCFCCFSVFRNPKDSRKTAYFC